MTDRQHDLIVAGVSAVLVFILVAATSAALGAPHIWPGAVLGFELNFLTALWLLPRVRRWEARRRNR